MHTAEKVIVNHICSRVFYVLEVLAGYWYEVFKDGLLVDGLEFRTRREVVGSWVRFSAKDVVVEPGVWIIEVSVNITEASRV